MRIIYTELKYLIVFKLIVLLLLFSCTIYAANVQIKLEGLDDKLKFNISSKLSSINNIGINVDRYFQNKIRDVIYSSLRAFGYYSPRVGFFLYKSSSCIRNDENYVLVIQVELGIPIKISKINVISNGNICHDFDYQKLIIDTQSLVGKILLHSEYDSFKDKLLNLSLSKGYLDAKFNNSQLVIFPNCHRSFWEIHFDSGQRYCFGEVKFYGGTVNEKYLKNLTNIRPGIYYDHGMLLELNRRLFATNWFSSVIISPDFVTGKDTKTLPINIFLVPSIINNFEIGLGYSSDIFGRFKVVWKRPCINSYGHSLENIFSVSVLEQFFNVNYKIPLLGCPLQEYYLLQGNIHRENIDNHQFSNVMVNTNISRYWDTITGWKRGINFHCCFNYYDQKKTKSLTTIVYPGVTIHRIRKRGGMMPIWGDSQYYSVDISSKFLKSDINFFLLQSHNIWIRTLFYKHRLVFRDHFGWIVGSNFQSLFPFVRRFFFISDCLIRGYKYQSLFFKNIILHSSLVVPSKLFVSSLEYQYNFSGKWWVVSFVDLGRIVRNIHGICYYKCGCGIGLRFQSPIGPFRLDLAMPLLLLFNKEGGFKLLHIYIGLGPEL